jgi:hypothetical protein
MKDLNLVSTNVKLMLTDDALLSKAKQLIEEKIQWGDSSDWTNQDFVALSEKIQEQLNIPLSHVTLKRIWGKVKYESLPNTHTLNTLVQFVGYENWREFKIKNGNTAQQPLPADAKASSDVVGLVLPKRKIYTSIDVAAVLSLLICTALIFIQAKKYTLNPDDYSFSSKKVVSVGVPNSVIFDYDATKYEGDSVIIQQSWDTKLRTHVPKDQHQHTSIYYFPEYYRAKLIVGNQVVKEHELFIKSDGWLTAVNTSPVPVYFKKEDVLVEGKLSLSIEKIKEKNINLQPEVRAAIYGNVNDFGEIYTDNFVFETSVRNEYEEGSSVCQKTNIYLLADRAPTGIPICEKGCISDIDFYFAGDHLSGKKKDLSAFGNNFNDFVKVRIETKNGAGKIFLDDKLVHEAKTSRHEKIIGIYFMFEGTGSVDYVRLASSDGLARFEDEF